MIKFFRTSQLLHLNLENKSFEPFLVNLRTQNKTTSVEFEGEKNTIKFFSFLFVFCNNIDKGVIKLSYYASPNGKE